ncbi:hypothetical protein PanWU01x14_195980 [Parasponia andersonii]|uniref:Uncharacterized protein n=1 Tax=Parasponia andersonii TaxID=3476 RepID=A0A2P5C031_PARAD|nr:hypothetical protein PanWU01x14_195980 [Parasponia andersonii]
MVAGIFAGDEKFQTAKNGIFPAGEHRGFAGPATRVTGGTVRQRRPVGRSDDVRDNSSSWSRSSTVSEEERTGRAREILEEGRDRGEREKNI